MRLLMMSVDVKRVNRDGIKLPWCEERYYHPDLYGRQRQGVTVRYDWQDRGRVWVYDRDGNFLCEAAPKMRVHPAAAILGTAADQAELRRQIELKRGLEKRTTGPMREFVNAHVIPEVRRQIEEAGFGVGEPAAPGGSGKAQGALQVVAREGRGAHGRGVQRAGAGKNGAPMTEEETERAQREFEEMVAERDMAADSKGAGEDVEEEYAPEIEAEPIIWEQLPTMGEMDRYEMDVELLAQAMLMPRAEQAWMHYFEETEMYRRNRDHFDQYRVKMALMYQGARYGRA